MSLVKILPPVFVISALLVLLGVWSWRRLRRRNIHLNERLISTEHEMEETQFQLEALRKVWEIDWNEIQRGECIGQGAMGQVRRGHWRGMAVAVKVLTGVYAPGEELREEMDREATMLQTPRHAHVVQFLGAGTTDEGMPFLITELMELGSLTGLLQNPDGEKMYLCVCACASYAAFTIFAQQPQPSMTCNFTTGQQRSGSHMRLHRAWRWCTRWVACTAT